jgi:DNA-directed RNA polymerase subunit RPC12/RpoP
MGTLHVKVLPQCNYCKEPACYDAPTRGEFWAYMCLDCSKRISTPEKIKIGTEFKIHKIVSKSPDKEVREGKVFIRDDYQTVVCPHCKGKRNLELDAGGIFDCLFCGQKILVKEVI